MKKRNLFFPLICLLLGFNLPKMHGQTLKTGIIAYYSFDDSTARDNSGHNHNGILVGSPKAVTGKCGGGAFSFDGKSQFIRVPSDTELYIGPKKDLTLSWWFNIDASVSTTKPTPFIAHVDSSTSGGSNNCDYVTYYRNGIVGWGTGDASDANAWMYISPLPSKGSWHHGVATMGYDSSTGNYTKNFYLDGKLVKTGSTKVRNISSKMDHLLLGASWNPSDGREYYTGYLDEIAIYDRVVSAKEADSLYNCGLTGIWTSIVADKNVAEGNIIISIYPNPASHVLNIQLNQSFDGYARIRIINFLGQTVLESSVVKGQSEKSFDVSQMSKGIYTILVSSLSGGVSSKQIVIE